MLHVLLQCPLAEVTSPFLASQLQLEIAYRGRALVHETGPLEGVIRALTQGEARGWLTEFRLGKAEIGVIELYNII